MGDHHAHADRAVDGRSDADGHQSRPDWLRLLGAVAPGSVAVALLYFFGNAYASAYFGYFGVDTDLLAMSNAKMLTLSADAALRAVSALTLLALGCLAARTAARTLLTRLRGSLHIGFVGVAAASSMSALAVGLVELQTHSLGSASGPVLLGLGAVGGEWCLAQAQGCASGLGRRWGSNAPRGHRILVICVTVLAAFWFSSEQAARQGRRDAVAFSHAARFRADLVQVFSSSRLRIRGSGVHETDLAGRAGPKVELRYRYTGLVLLNYADHRWLLIPRGIGGAPGPVFILDDLPGELRVDMVDAASPT